MRAGGGKRYTQNVGMSVPNAAAETWNRRGPSACTSRVPYLECPDTDIIPKSTSLETIKFSGLELELHRYLALKRVHVPMHAAVV